MLGVSGEDSVSAESGFYSPIRCDLCTVNVLVHSSRVTSWESCPPSQVLCSQPQCISASSSLTGNGSKSENGFPDCFRKRSATKATKSWSPLRSFSPGNLLYLASCKVRQYKQLCSFSLWLPFQEFHLQKTLNHWIDLKHPVLLHPSCVFPFISFFIWT